MVISLLNEKTVPVQVAATDPANAAVVNASSTSGRLTSCCSNREAGSATSGMAICPRRCSWRRPSWALATSAFARGASTSLDSSSNLCATTIPAVKPQTPLRIGRAVATYEASGQADGLQAGWDILRSRYPESIWRTKIIFYEIGDATQGDELLPSPSKTRRSG